VNRHEKGSEAMKIHLYIIDKKGKRELYDPLVEHYIKSCRSWAKVEIHEIFGKEIAKAQEISPEAAQRAYTRALAPYLEGHATTITLDPLGEMVDSHGFADCLRDRGEVRLFIGGAYGFERSFLKQSDKTVSFGRITLSHKLVKVVLLEQIFRGLSINHGHPYHK
jgi:23S rRNA (pseudouridine1915-N3)-methyltransferase